jgi:uncharacterized protein YjbI with pentapeptide repeats
MKDIPKEVLRQVFDHHRWLRSGGVLGKRFCAEALQLDEMDLAGADFSKAHLPRVTFHRTKLTGTSFVGCNLEGAYIVDAEIGGANFDSAKLKGALFDGSNFGDSFFGSAEIEGILWVATEPYADLYAYSSRQSGYIHPPLPSV